MKERVKLLFVRPFNPPYISRDVDILREHFEVRVIDFTPLSINRVRKSIDTVLSMIRGTLWADITFSWFAGEHAYWTVSLSHMFRRASLVIVGGYEVANEPEIGYGSLLNPKSRSTVLETLKVADKILVVSEFTGREVSRLDGHRTFTLVYNGIDCAQFTPGEAKENLVVTVCMINKMSVKLKGLNTFINVARHLPHTKFAIVGVALDGSINILKQYAPSNIIFADSPSQDEILQWYRRAKVYCQLSYRESFGVSLAEAMACGCVPVVTDRGALPEVVGDTGFVVPFNDPERTIDAVQKALTSNRGAAARERVKVKFSREKREIGLKNAILDIVGQH